MGLKIKSVKFDCYNDCRISGCPGHETIIEYNTTSDGFHIKRHTGQDIFLCPGEMQSIIDALIIMDQDIGIPLKLKKDKDDK